MFSGLMLYFVSKNTISSLFLYIFCQQIHYSKPRFRLYVGILSAVTIFTDIFSALRPIIVFCHQIHYSKTCFLLYICILWAVTLFKVMFTVLLLFFVSRYTIQRHALDFVAAFCQQIHYSQTYFRLHCCLLSAVTLFKDWFQRYCCILSAVTLFKDTTPALLLYFVRR